MEYLLCCCDTWEVDGDISKTTSCLISTYLALLSHATEIIKEENTHKEILISKGDSEKHFEVETGKKECFARKGSLKLHTGIREYECKQCHKFFAHKTN